MQKTRSFTPCGRLPLSIAQDKNLSLEAKGLYLLIKSCIEDPEFDCEHLRSAVEAKCKEGSEAFDSTWKELERAGYLTQQRTPSLETLRNQDKSIPPEHLVLGKME
jgi:hypothetical protein